MKLSRRALLKSGLAASAAVAPAAASAPDPEFAHSHEPAPDWVGVLVDTTLCIGCRKCEEACNTSNHLPRTAEPFANRDVLQNFRRPSESAFTVVNQFPGSPSPDQSALHDTHVKTQCQHCLTPSCVSACVVGALTKARDGAVVYDPSICMGCRYCLVACPFEVPAYEYDTPLTPRVRKCQFCADRTSGGGADPACAAACPTEALVFGHRVDLLALAHDRIRQRPDRYVDHVYGETEVGGTAWLYLLGRPYEEVGLLDLPETAPALRTEAIQHGIFKYGFLPTALYGALAGMMWYSNRREAADPGEPEDSSQSGGGE